ncbi:MAG: glucan biosynthesis protein [Opitutaceae bacterium]
MRTLIAIWAALAMIAGVAAADAPFNFYALSQQARRIALEPYRPQSDRVPPALAKLDYDHYRDIRFRPPMSWWNHDAVPFKLQFFMPGSIYTHKVRLNELDDGRVTPIPFSSRYFDFGRLNPKLARIRLPKDLGYAGFRITYPLNAPGDELGVFLGASYFRFLCRGATYGLSARGLAIDVADPKRPEEFPDFDEFWIRRPSGPNATELVVYALLDSPSVAGAYRFVIVPGAETVMHVQARLYFRRNPDIPGIAPLTSMFWHGSTTDFETDDIRPQVHDSDGFMLHTGAGEWLWRPLTNYLGTRTMSFVDENPKGFGLMQRERRFEAYDDLEADYQSRPSAWVVPKNPWGPGEVRLVILDTRGEGSDNVVAFWKPLSLPRPGIPVDVKYDLYWALDQIRPPLGYCVETRQGRTPADEPGVESFIIDFDGPKIQKLGPDAKIVPVISVGDAASLVHFHSEKNRFDGTWRVGFGIRPDGTDRPVELRCYLKRGSELMSETWSYLWVPPGKAPVR